MSDEDKLSTADLVAGTERQHHPQAQAQAQASMPSHAAQPVDAMPSPQGQAPEQLVPLFAPQMTDEFRKRWEAVQIGFVDDPHHAVQQADELVAHVIKKLAESFAQQRSQLEAGLGQQGQQGQVDTEHLRMALRGYRSFFIRLLSV